MSKGREIRSFDYVNRPYPAVRDALRDAAVEIFSRSTKAAASRAHTMASELRVNIAGLDVATDVVISVGEIEEVEASTKSPAKTLMPVEWEAAKRPRLFPLMRGVLSIYSLTATETQLDFNGEYEPPLGVVGGAMNAVIGHRIADAAVHRFVRDVASYLREHLDKE